MASKNNAPFPFDPADPDSVDPLNSGSLGPVSPFPSPVPTARRSDRGIRRIVPIYLRRNLERADRMKAGKKGTGPFLLL